MPIINQSFSYDSFEKVDLRTSEPDPKLGGLIITQPADDFDDAALGRIDAYVMHGGSLIVAASAANLIAGDMTMTVKLGSHRLSNLLSGYGIDLHEDRILDTKEGFKSMSGGANVNAPFLPVPTSK